jgi:class 3 adenylate cyclase
VLIHASPELAAVMERILHALEVGDIDTLRTLFHAGDRTVIVGSDPIEWSSGPGAVDIFLWQVEQHPPWHYSIQRLEAFEEGTVGWAVSDEIAHLESGESVLLRKTAVFHLDGGIWRVVHWNASAPVPDDPEVVGVDLTTGMARLLESIDLDAESVSVRSALETSTVTLVFTDIEDSTRRTAEAGDGEWTDVIQAHFSDIARVAQRHGGMVVKTLGDGAVMAFDSSRGGLEAAIEVQRAAERRSSRMGGTDAPLRVRVGVNTGDAVRAGGDFFGQMVNKTARIAAAAAPGQILASDVVRGLVGEGGSIAFGEALMLDLKGMRGIHTVYPVVIRDRS